MDQAPAPTPPRKGRLTRRLISGFAIALTLALSVYLLLNASRAGAMAFASLWFLALFPALLSALICYVGDPDRTRRAGFYWQVPLILVGLVDFGSAFVLKEGVICLLMVSPIWVLAGWGGAMLLRSLRGRYDNARTLQSGFLILPLVAGLVEAQIPVPHDPVVVSRSIVVHATPEEIWPFAVSNPSISPKEGRWTFSQSILGLPRPSATVVAGHGVGAVRTARWGEHVNFDEQITDWRPGERLGWRFSFTNSSLQDFTDKHISPDGEFLKIDTGDYSLRRIAPGVTELTLNTRYIAKTHVNLYAAAWGELILGDTQDNILTIIKDRAEAAHARRGRAL